MIPNDPDERDVLAGEYVLGALDEATRSEVEALLRTDHDLARRVLAWEHRLLPAAATTEPTLPEPETWRRIERSLASMPSGTPTRVPMPARRVPAAALLWRSLPAWRLATGLATAAALLLAAFPLRERPGPEPGTRYYVVLQTRDAAGQESGPGWIIQIADDGSVRSTPLGRVDPGQGRALQLWTLWDQARGPVSLGVLPPGGSVRLPPEALPTIGGGQLFEITLEPSAGSPTGRPTGRILFIGRASPAPTQSL